MWGAPYQGKGHLFFTHIPQFALAIFAKSLVERFAKVELLRNSTI
jgi:hypothetical protein